jgi:hypothetical protein
VDLEKKYPVEESKVYCKNSIEKHT